MKVILFFKQYLHRNSFIQFSFLSVYLSLIEKNVPVSDNDSLREACLTKRSMRNQTGGSK